MSYTSWLTRLVQHFFGPQYADQHVRLLVTRGFLDEVFPDLGGTNGFLTCIRSGPEWLESERTTLHSRGLKLHYQWEHRHSRPSSYPKSLENLQDAPPFLPYLCLLCLAWTEGEGEDIASHEFYGRLTLLYPNHNLNTHLGDWFVLWNGLEEWTEKLKKAWGCFSVELLGKRVNVDIPRSQVIFTPRKIERLPELFIGCGLQPEASVSSAELRELLRINSGTAIQVLGSEVFKHVLDNTPLGGSALLLISEHLASWDGNTQEITNDDSNGGTQTNTPGRLVLVLESADENSRWVVRLGVEEGKEIEGIEFSESKWGLLSVDSRLAIVVDSDRSFIDASAQCGDLTNSMTILGKWRNDTSTSDDVSFRLAGKEIYFFGKWVAGSRPRLVESQGLPAAGHVYILLSSKVSHDWKVWIEKYGGQISMQDYTWKGLPVGWQLWYVDKLEGLSEGARHDFPEGAGLSTFRPRVIRLLGGTRARSSAARRVYAEYDPPFLLVQAPEAAEVVVMGAMKQGLSTESHDQRLPGDVARCFALTIEPESSVIVAKVLCDGKELGGVNFGVWRDHGSATTQPNGTTHAVDKFGDIYDGSGLRGATIKGSYEEWIFNENPEDASTACSEAIFQHQSFKFLESLHHQSSRLTFQEFRRRALEIGGVEPWRLHDETRWLAQLAFLEMQLDSWGRWSHVHPNPLHLYLLPWTKGGSFQCVVTGCGFIADWKRVLETANQLDCKVRVLDNCCKLFPPRVTLLHDELSAFELLSHELKLPWDRQPAAFSIVNWAAGLEDWLNGPSLNWFTGEGPRPVGEYVPSEFRMTSSARHAAPFRLYCMEDPYTRRHYWHTLVNNNWEHGLRHAFVRDSAWGRWKAQNAICDGDTILPYHEETGSLIVPCQLVFPYLLGRVLCLSSGLVPKLVRNCSAFTDAAAGVLATEAPPYNGACWAYHFVPRSIAERIGGKICAELKNMVLT